MLQLLLRGPQTIKQDVYTPYIMPHLRITLHSKNQTSHFLL